MSRWRSGYPHAARMPTHSAGRRSGGWQRTARRAHARTQRPPVAAAAGSGSGSGSGGSSSSMFLYPYFFASVYTAWPRGRSAGTAVRRAGTGAAVEPTGTRQKTGQQRGRRGAGRGGQRKGRRRTDRGRAGERGDSRGADRDRGDSRGAEGQTEPNPPVGSESSGPHRPSPACRAGLGPRRGPAAAAPPLPGRGSRPCTAARYLSPARLPVRAIPAPTFSLSSLPLLAACLPPPTLPHFPTAGMPGATHRCSAVALASSRSLTPPPAEIRNSRIAVDS